MAEDIFKPVGPLPASKPDSGGMAAQLAPLFGVVKDNADPSRTGRLLVYVSGFGGNDPNNRDNWVSVNYMTPFYGATIPDAADNGYGTYVNNPSSYGMWYAQPDIGSVVICIFVNGDINYGFWIGCAPKPEALTMVPAVGATDNIVPNIGEAKSYGGATRLPVTNINVNNIYISDSTEYIKAPKPVHSFQAGIMMQQGILRDRVRGPISSTSQRESPSRVGWGVSTPGRPIYTGGFTDATLPDALKKIANNTSDKPSDESLRVIARRGGHSIVMDDGNVLGEDQLIRIRTALGHQILMSDDGQTLMILHSNGQSYIELGKEGTVDVYSTNSINLRTQGDLNLHADNNVNIHAGKEFNLQADNIRINSEKEITTKSGTNTKAYALGTYTVKTDSAMSFQSTADSSFVSESVTYINGSKINLNTGSSSTIPEEVKPIPIVAHTDTLHDPEKGFAAAPGKLMSITSRAPAHAPWANAGQGVDIKTDLSAASNLPAAPTSQVAKANETAATIPSTSTTPGEVIANPGVALATATSMPYTQSVSKALDKNTTSSLLGAATTIAASGPLKEAIGAGFKVLTPSGGPNQLGIGIFAQTASQLVSAGILKTGADRIVNTVLSNLTAANPLVNIQPNPSITPDISKLIPSNLFTGKTGAENINSYINNVAIQATAQVVNFQKAQTALTIGGAIKGDEAPQQIAGLVLAGTQGSLAQGLQNTKDALTAAVGSGFTLSGATAGVQGALKAIQSGELAANLSQNITGALGGLSAGLNALTSGATKIPTLAGLVDSVNGIAGSAFNSIVKQFKPLTAYAPQNLTEIAKKAQESIDEVAGDVASLAPGIAAKASSLASGLSNLPGGERIVQAVIDKSAAEGITAPINKLPGTGAVQALATEAFNAVTKGDTFKMPSIPGNVGGLLNKAISVAGLQAGASAQLQSAIAALASGGKFPIKLPAVGFSTNVRGGIESQISSVFGTSTDDARSRGNLIPPPNFSGEVSMSAKEAIKRQEELLAERKVLFDDYLAALDVSIAKKKLYYEELKNPSATADTVKAAEKAWFDASDIAAAKGKLYDKSRT